MTPYLTLDFDAPPATRRLRQVVLGVGIVALLVGGIELAAAWQLHAQARAELASLDQRDARRAERPRAPVDAATVRAVAAVARDLQAPWPQLMRSLEASRNSDISLLQLEPIVARDSIRLTADARHAAAMLDYLAKLNSEGLSDVLLTSHEVRLREPGTPIRFQAQARWTRLATPPNDIVTAAAGPSPSSAPATPEPSTAPASESSDVPGSDLANLQRFIEQERSIR